METSISSDSAATESTENNNNNTENKPIRTTLMFIPRSIIVLNPILWRFIIIYQISVIATKVHLTIILMFDDLQTHD